ncbi:YciC family protein [Bacteroidota bacterium]
MLENEFSSVKKAVFLPGILSSYGNGWRMMWKFILELLLITIVSFVLSIPTLGLSVQELVPVLSEYITIHLLLFEIEGPAAFYLLSIAYLILIEWPLEYGVAFTMLKAARNEKPEVKNIFLVFKNYSNSVLANLLTTLIIGIGFILLIIPGIVFACKLAFVPYLIVERKLDAVSAVKESWRMTSGHAFKLFIMGFLAFFVALLGLLFLGVGILISIIWIRVAFASLYFAVSSLEAKKTLVEETE